VSHPLDVLVGDPWRALDALVDGPLHPGGRAATEELLDRTAVGDGTAVLDVGCGRGEALRLARERGARPVGLDRDPNAEDTVVGDMTALPFRDGSFDVALGECVLCLSPDLERTLCDVARILGDGGRLGLSDVTVTGEPPTLPPPIDRLVCLDGQREQGQIRRSVERAGFEVQEIETRTDDLLEMRNRIREAIDFERLAGALGERGDDLREGLRELEAAVESGRVGYVSIVATKRS